MAGLARLAALLPGSARRRRVMTYDDLDGGGNLPGQVDTRAGAEKLAHNDALQHARMNASFGPH